MNTSIPFAAATSKMRRRFSTVPFFCIFSPKAPQPKPFSLRKSFCHYNRCMFVNNERGIDTFHNLFLFLDVYILFQPGCCRIGSLRFFRLCKGRYSVRYGKWPFNRIIWQFFPITQKHLFSSRKGTGIGRKRSRNTYLYIKHLCYKPLDSNSREFFFVFGNNCLFNM